jgi:acetylornithine deacetylase/succinyl-diaminopimelate desuccinylase family protein
LDTVPTGKGWTKDPFSAELTDTHIWGRGATDMKGGLAVMAMAMKALKDSGADFSGEIVFVGVVGEEENQAGTRFLMESGFRADYAIVCEPTDLLVVNAHKGAINCAITVYGKGAHASTPEEGKNAIYHASRLSLALEEYAGHLQEKRHPVLGSPTFVVGTVQGGQVPYMVADYCQLMIDRRLIPGESYKESFEEIREVLEPINKRFPEFRVEVDMTVSTPPMETDPDSPVVEALRKNAADITGEDKGVHGWPAVSDGNVLVEGGIPTALFGPGDIGGMAHKPDEGIETRHLVEAARVLAGTLLDLLDPSV